MSIGSFILRRLGSGALAVVGASVLVFLFLHVVPGDPIDHLAGDQATPQLRHEIETCMGLDRSLPDQLLGFFGHVVDGTLGHQCPYPTGKPTVRDRITDALPYTIELALAAMLLAIVMAIPLGVIAAVRRGTWTDTGATLLALSGMSVPIMLLAPLLLGFFFARLGWLPGPTELGVSGLILPSIALATHLMAMLARMTRSSMVEVLGEDFVRTARAKGLAERRVIYVHALRNALLPVITVAGLQFGSLLSGAIIVERVFSRPGLGTLLLDAIFERNYPVVQGTVLVIAVIYVVVNTLVDLAYGFADPRIRRG